MAKHAQALSNTQPAAAAPIQASVSPPSQAALSAQNELALAKAMRRLREVVADGQARRADGFLRISLELNAGAIVPRAHLNPQWTERL